jgi:SOS-response transcriptional repressor LexA
LACKDGPPIPVDAPEPGSRDTPAGDGGEDPGTGEAEGRAARLPIDRTPLRKSLCEAADRFIEREGRPPTAKELQAEAGVGSHGSAERVLAAWRKGRGIARPPIVRSPVAGTVLRERMLEAADRFLDRLGRHPTAQELQFEAGIGSYGTAERVLTVWRRKRGIVRGRYGGYEEAFREAAERFLERVGRAPTAPELHAEAGQGPPFQVREFLKEWCAERGVAIDTPLHRDMEQFADGFLAEQGRAPTYRELVEAIGRGSDAWGYAFLHSWREKRGLPLLGRSRPRAPIREDVREVIDALAESLGRVPTIHEIMDAHGSISSTTSWNQRTKWLEMRGLPKPRRGRQDGSREPDDDEA